MLFAALHQRLPFGGEALQLDRADSEPSCSFWLRFCACSLSSSSRSIRLDGAVEEINGRPEQVLEIRFKAGVGQR